MLPLQDRPADRSVRPWPALPPAVVAGLLFCLPAASVIAAGLLAPRMVVGDGQEYVAMYLAWLKTGRPWLSAPVYEAYEALRAAGPLARLRPLDAMLASAPALDLGNGTHDLNHHWFYSGLAALLGWLCPAGLCADPTRPVLALHAGLALLASWTGWSCFGLRGLAAAALLLVVSPTLWFAARIHTEYFTAALTIAGVFLVLGRRYPGAALAFALASTQNPSFGIPAVVAGLVWLADRRRPAGRLDAVLVAAGALAAILHPAYYWFRFGGISPQLFGAGAHVDLADILRLSPAWLLDPDLGLFPNWPLGLLLLGFGAAAVRWCDRAGAGAWICLGSLLAANLAAHGSGDNVNSGGTVHVARYGTWYLCLLVPFALAWLRALAAAPAGRLARAGIGAVSLAAALAAWQYRPWRPEVFIEPTPLSWLIQSHLPGLYDPPPELFGERYGGLEPLDVAAVVGPDCRKVAFRQPEGPVAPRVVSRACPGALFDGAALLKELAGSQARRDRHGWAVDRLSAEASARARTRWTGAVTLAGPDLPPELFVSGWSGSEDFGTWSDGPEARLAVPVARAGYPGGLRLTLRLVTFPPGGTQHVGVTAGGETRSLALGPGDRSLTLDVPASRLDETLPLAVAFALPEAASPQSLGLGADGRLLAIALTGIAVEPMPAAP